MAYDSLKVCDRELVFNLQMMKRALSVKAWPKVVRLGCCRAGSWSSGLTPEPAVLGHPPHPGAWPTGAAKFGSESVRACGKRLGTQGKCGLINKLKPGYHVAGDCNLGVNLAVK